MNKRILSAFLLCGLAAATAQGQIGIQTVNPKGALHIDGASSPATVNPATGDVSGLQASDDVIINNKGQIGIGLLEPAARVDILSDSPPGGALRIQDGTEGEGKFLFSDNKGVGSWAFLATGSWYAALYDGDTLDYTATQGYREHEVYADSLLFSGNEESVDAAAGTITVPYTGKYRISITLYWDSDRTSGTTPYITRTILRVNGIDRKTYSYWGTRGGMGGSVCSFIDIRELGEGDVLKLATDETLPNSANKAQASLFMVELLQ